MLHMLADPEVTQEGSVEALFSYPVCVSLDILGPDTQKNVTETVEKQEDNKCKNCLLNFDSDLELSKHTANEHNTS